MKQSKSGYTLIELLLVMAIIVVIAGAVTLLPIGQKFSIEIEEEANKMVSILRTAQSNTVTGEQGATWGVHIDNTGSPFYELFYGNSFATSTSTEHITLPTGIKFEQPQSGASTTVHFKGITGAVTNGTTTIIRIADTVGNYAQTITVTPIGQVTKTEN